MTWLIGLAVFIGGLSWQHEKDRERKFQLILKRLDAIEDIL